MLDEYNIGGRRFGADREAGMTAGTAQKDARAATPILLSANSFWNIVNFRGPLVDALVDAGFAVSIAAPSADREWAKERGAEAIQIAIDRSGLNPVTDAGLWFQYLKHFRRLKPRFFLGFTAKPNIYGSLAAHLAGVACLPNVSGLGTAFMRDGPLAALALMLYRLAFRRCPVVFFQNPDDRDLFVAKKIIKLDQARLLPGSGIDLTHFTAAPMPDDSAQPCFLFIGRLLGDKGVREFVEAVRLLRPQLPSWRFQLLGEIDRENRSGITALELQQWVDQGIVEHLGHAEDVRPFIAASTAVVLPSYREGLPRSLLEAAAMARPLIATDVPGNRQLIAHGVNGLLCEVRSGQSLADAMLQIGSLEPGRRLQMGQAARALVEREYGVERVVRAYLEALEQLSGSAGVEVH